MKTLDDLEIIEQKINHDTLERGFFRVDNGPRIPKESITILTHPPNFTNKNLWAT